MCGEVEGEREGEESMGKCPCFKMRKMSEKQRRAEHAMCVCLPRETRQLCLIGKTECARDRTGLGPPGRHD